MQESYELNHCKTGWYLLNSWHETSTIVPEIQEDSFPDLCSDDVSRELAPFRGAVVPGFRA
jgi:hypothetical protein